MLRRHIDNKVCEKHKKKEKYKVELKMTYEYELEEIKKLKDENQSLKDENETLRKNRTIINNQQINNIDKQQINILVPPSFLTVDTLSNLMKMFPNLIPNALSKHPTHFVSYLIKETNCNPNLPLFNSIHITNKKDSFGKISDGNQYIYAPKKKIISQLIENKRSLLQEYVDRNGDKYGEKILRRYQRYVDALDDDPEIIRDLEIEITCMLLNMGSLIGSDDWSQKLLQSMIDNGYQID
jgi:hypothetical protein